MRKKARYPSPEEFVEHPAPIFNNPADHAGIPVQQVREFTHAMIRSEPRESADVPEHENHMICTGGDEA
jgi:hypothetical protein